MTEVAARILELLRARGSTLALAESLTGGALADAFVAVPGASAVLNGAIVAYATPVKHTLLGVDAALLETEGPVHAEVARGMADGARTALAVAGRAADVGLATTGVAGPDPQHGVPPGTVYVGLALDGRIRAIHGDFVGNRAEIRAAAVALALDTLLTALVEE